MANYYPMLWPILRRIEPETAHRLTLSALRAGIVPTPRVISDPALNVRIWELPFANPIGLAAGFDKNAEVFGALLGCGFGFVEVGTVTPRAQPGNKRPRLFRLEQDHAVINRFGFNNDGMEAVARRLSGRDKRGIVGANVGPNKDSADPIADCANAVAALAGVADYLVVNVSSPNTPGLRKLQGRDALDRLLATVIERRNASRADVPLLVKIAPDLESAEIRDIAELAIAYRVDGLIATNTTVERPDTLSGRHRNETGGLSGKPLFQRSTAVLAEVYRHSSGRLPLIGVGGVSSGADAYAKIRAGATLVQLYTALVYDGPWLVSRIKRELADLLRRDGFSNVAEAVGADAR